MADVARGVDDVELQLVAQPRELGGRDGARQARRDGVFRR